MTENESTAAVLGTRIWRRNSMKHREDGPAVIFVDGEKWWYQLNGRHRTDGPAIEFADGQIAWYYNNLNLTFADYVKVAKWSDEQIVMYKLGNF